MEEYNYPLADMAEWEAFAEANEYSLLEMYPTIGDALKAACDGGLVMGGGASPIVHVYFVD
jgi:hypothetical protein